MRFKEGDKVQFIENNELIIGTIKRVNNDVGWVDLKVSDLSWFFRKFEDVVKVKEPELIAVPRFAADWIKHCKQREYDLACLLDYEDSDMSAEMYEWLISSADNQELLARAWLDGYEVEKEPLYYVETLRLIAFRLLLCSVFKGHFFFFVAFSSNSYILLYSLNNVNTFLEIIWWSLAGSNR